MDHHIPLYIKLLEQFGSFQDFTVCLEIIKNLHPHQR